MLHELESEQISMLCLLLDEADKGRWPSFWREARVVGIPKLDSSDLRPLTILSVLYRLWAKRIAWHLNVWLDSFLPAGAFGARIGRFVADAVCEAAQSIEFSRVGGGPACHVMVLDQAKLFMRDNAPVAYVSWARLSNDVAQRYQQAPHHLSASDWKSGEQVWLVDLCTPFGGVQEVMKDLRESVFAGQEIHQLALDGHGQVKAMTWPGLFASPGPL
jgi:cytolysin-activating lysine-acyltransferase